MRSCTCHAPPTVDLTEALAAAAAANTKSIEAELLLRETLSQYGWCIVSIELGKLDDESPLKAIQPLKMKQQVQELFDPEFVASKKNSVKNAVYRGRMAESGSGQEEPKQSWEVKRCCREPNGLPTIHEWTRALHSVAVAVTRVLKLPPNLLLKEEDCHCTMNEQTCNIDLLRVFFYDDVTDNDASSLGSSPHTDWGSWTVVWQDDVGGLQTYCHAHERWASVPAPPLEESRVFFVVHVGDVTSLAMGHASSAAVKSNEQDSIQAPTVVWPSPRHRVLSPRCSVPRASLVYFAYPPPGVSMKAMEESLAGYYKADLHAAVPYDEYFVLQNQSTTGSTRSPKETYSAIRLRPLNSVFDEKWQQVQR